MFSFNLLSDEAKATTSLLQSNLPVVPLAETPIPRDSSIFISPDESIVSLSLVPTPVLSEILKELALSSKPIEKYSLPTSLNVI